MSEDKDKKTNKKIAIFAIILIVLGCLFIICVEIIFPYNEYNNALELMENDQYEEAESILISLHGFLDSENKLSIIKSIDHLKQGNYHLAINGVIEAKEIINVKYNLNGGQSTSGDSFTYTSASDYSGLLQPEKEGYKFVQWRLIEYNYSNDKSLSIVLDAVWTNTFSLTYELNGGTATNPKQYRGDDGSITLNNPVKNGYTFIGWTGTDLDGLTMNVTIPAGSYGDKKYQANWSTNQYTITLDANGGTVSQSTLVIDYNSSYTLPTPTRDYYTFAGWYNENTKYTDGMWIKASDITLQAEWNPIPYTITYNLNGGTNSEQNPTTYSAETKIDLKNPTRNGYKFLGWYSDSSYKNKVSEIAIGSHDNITLYAKWELATYTITYKLNGGTLSGTKTTTFTINDLPIALPSAYQNNYAFLGWKVNDYNGEDITSITTCGDITLYASYIDVYLQLKLTTPTDGTQPYYSVTGYAGKATFLDIPAYYEGYPVTAIGYMAFYGKNQITSINIPSTVTKIDTTAFYNCTALKNIQLPSQLTYLGNYAFGNCTALENIQLPSQLTYLGSGVFSGCISINSIEIPATVPQINEYAFDGCTNLENVILHEGLQAIDKFAFNSPKLIEFVIPKSVQNISKWAFFDFERSNCTNIVFYCYATIMPSGWSIGWNGEHAIIWGYNESTYQKPTYNFVTNGGTPIASMTKTQISTMPQSTKDGYFLLGWYDNAQLSGDPVAFPYYDTNNTTLYAKWIKKSDLDGLSANKAYYVEHGKTYSNYVYGLTNKYYRFVPTETRSYTIKTLDETNVEYYLYDSKWNPLDNDSGLHDLVGVSITYYLIAGQEYYIRIESIVSIAGDDTTFVIE